MIVGRPAGLGHAAKAEFIKHGKQDGREERQLAFETMHQPDRNALQVPPSFAFLFLSAWLAQMRTTLPVLPPEHSS